MLPQETEQLQVLEPMEQRQEQHFEIQKVFPEHSEDELKNNNGRAYHLAILENSNWMIILGGQTSYDEQVASSQYYDFEKNSWSSEGPILLPNPLCFFSMIQYPPYYYLFGGAWKEKDKWNFSNEVLCFDSELGSIERVSTKNSSPENRCGHTAVTYKGQMFIFGGLAKDKNDKFKWFSDLWCLSLEDFTWSKIEGKGPSPRSGHSAVVFKEKMYLFGGHFTSSKKEYYNDLYEFDFSLY